MAYLEGIDWARQQRERRAQSLPWRPPVDDWADWCERYYLTVMHAYGAPGPEGFNALTQQQKYVRDGVRAGLAAAWKHLYPPRHEAPPPPNVSREDSPA